MASISKREWKNSTTYKVEVRKKGRTARNTFDSEMEADKWAADREHEIKYDLPFPWEIETTDDSETTTDTRSDKLLDSAIDKFIFEKTGLVSPSQIKNYGFSKSPLIKFFGKSKKMSEIHKSDMANYVLKRMTEDKVGASSIRNELSLIRKAYEQAHAWSPPVCYPSPEKDIVRPTHKKLSREDGLEKIADVDELNAIFRCAKFRKAPFYLFIRFLLFTGMRPSEAASLYWEKLPVKIEKEMRKKQQPIGYVDLKRGGYSMVGTKTETRFVPAHPEATAIIKILQKERGKTKKEQSDKLVFLDDKHIGRLNPYKYYRRSMQTTMANARVTEGNEEELFLGVLKSDSGPIVKERQMMKLGSQLKKDLNFYSFRHTIRSNMAKCGIPTEVGETIIGHNDKSFKFTYIHLTDEQLVKEMAKLNYPGLEKL